MSALHGHFFFIPATMTSNFQGFLSQILSITIVFSLFLRRSQYFPYQCWVLNKGTTGTIFIMSLVWRDPWQGIEPRTSLTRSQYSTARLSRRCFYILWLFEYFYSRWSQYCWVVSILLGGLDTVRWSQYCRMVSILLCGLDTVRWSQYCWMVSILLGDLDTVRWSWRC